MVDPAILKVLCCPETHQELHLAGAEELAKLNKEISAGVLRNRAGRLIPGELPAALVRADGKVAYAIQNDIPVMLIDEAIDLK